MVSGVYLTISDTAWGQQRRGKTSTLLGQQAVTTTGFMRHEATMKGGRVERY